jgi:hypothetical protein
LLGTSPNALPLTPPGVDICAPGAVRPAIVQPQVGCTKQSDGVGLQATLNAAQPGDRICVQGNSADRMRLTRSGTAAGPIMVVGDGLSSVQGISINADYVVVRGFNVTGATAPGVEIRGNEVTLLDNVVSSPRGGDGDGIRFFGNGIKILHNTISDVRNLGGAHADCMQTFATNTPTSSNVLIHSNRCEKIANQCLIAEGPNSSAGDGSGRGSSSNITFANNFCESNAAQAVMIDDVQNVVVVGNEITGRNRKAFAFANRSTGAVVRDNKIGQGILFEVGMDSSSRPGYVGPAVGGGP